MQTKERLLERVNALVEENRNLRIRSAELEAIAVGWEAWAEEAKGVLANENRRVGELEGAMVRAVGLLRAVVGVDPPPAIDVDFEDEPAA
jgi:hypothetical protein